MTFSIGEFSRITRISVKALRLYHERGLLRPDFVDPESGYRYYAADQVNEARVIQALKRMGFSLAEIGEALDECDEDGELVERLEGKRRQLELKVRAFRKAIDEIELLLRAGRHQGEPEDAMDEVEETLAPDQLVVGYRMRGRYEEVGKGFAKLMWHAGRRVAGKPMCLYYDGEYKEEGADFEPAVPLSGPVEPGEFSVRELRGGPALRTLHVGPYEGLGAAYARLFAVAKREGARLRLPTREVYHRGPGMVLKGRPERYVTEVQFPLEEG